MIDLLSLGLTHALLIIAAWRLVRRPDLDREDADGIVQPTAPRRWGAKPDA